MAHWLASPGDAETFAHVKRFDPRYWSVNFPRPMMASAVSQGAHGLRVDCTFYRGNDLAGLIWDAADGHGHPLLRYETARDFRECVLSFGWASDGLMPLDAVNGPTLTIEGRDADGAPRSWYVRLWNYATGEPEAARVRIDFADLQGGFALPEEAVPVWRGTSTACSSAWCRRGTRRRRGCCPRRRRRRWCCPTWSAMAPDRFCASATGKFRRTGFAWRRGMTTSTT
jgi:hypothetical protein